MERLLPAFRESKKRYRETVLSIEFAVDTFRIERYVGKYLEYDYTTAGMRTATYEAGHRYDSLLNKYYKKLLSKLKPDDRNTLVEAQKAWINYRDKELNLVEVIGKDEYSGGGVSSPYFRAS